MVTVIVTHEVSNFASWKTGFDNDSQHREKAGLKLVGLATSLSNPNMVTIIMDAPSKEMTEGMMSSPDFQETMKNAGVIGKPQVTILNKA